jgi:NAD(P)-dependent dehydrogenase (short-subunit alcohol dehydrogenase family)
VSTLPKALAGRCAIVTGASQGLGLEIARHYLEAGASLMICARDQAMICDAGLALNSLAGSGQSVTALAADISQPQDVARLVAAALAQFGQLDILVNNAGVAGPNGALETLDWADWIRTIEINLLGAVLLSRAILPHFKQARRGKFIQLSGGGAANALPLQSAYATSKAAVVRFIETMAEETRQYHIDVNAIAPGALDTRMRDQFIADGPERMGREFYERALRLKTTGGVPLAFGAELAVFLGSPLSDGITGKLISATWDPWKTLPDHLEELRRTDIYSLRRITPRDRGMTWGDSD